MARSPLLDLAFGFTPGQVVYAAAELRMADALAAGLTRAGSGPG